MSAARHEGGAAAAAVQPAPLARDPSGGSQQPAIAVVCALPEELAPLVRRMRIEGRSRIGGAHARWGFLGALPVALGVTGAGDRLAEAGAGALADRFRPRLLVGLGIAAGLSPELRAGDLVAARLISCPAGPVPFSEAAWARRAAARAGAAEGVLVSVDRILVSPADKQRAWRAAGAPVPAAADLESAGWARAAARRGIPFLAVRAVSDGAGEELPAILARAASPEGGLRRARIAVPALVRPALLRELLGLRRRVRRCAERLAGLAEALIVEAAAAEREGRWEVGA